MYGDVMNSSIVVDPDICNGKPVVAGTRITVQTILGFLAAGDSVDSLLKAYPSLSRKDIEAVFDYASKIAGHNFLVEAVS